MGIPFDLHFPSSLKSQNATEEWLRPGPPLSLLICTCILTHMDAPFLKSTFYVSFSCSPEGICVGSGRDNHCLPFSADGLLRTEIWQGKIITLPSLSLSSLCHLPSNL